MAIQLIPRWNLFLTLFPDFYSRTQLTYLTAAQREKHRLSGTPLAEHRYHVSLHGWGSDRKPSESFVLGVGTAAEGAARWVPPFEVKFDRTVSFGKSRAFVLCSQGGNAVLKQFREELGMALRSYGMPCVSSFNPHVTLLYDDRTVHEEVVEPVSWIVNDFALVCRLIGKPGYRILKRWKLRG